MQTVKRFFNPTLWRQWAIVFLAGLVVMATTACGTTQAAVPAPNNTFGAAQAADSEGMYPHKDTIRDTSAADAKADRMIRQAEQRIQQNSKNPLKEAADNIGESTQQAAENAAENTQKSLSNLKQNAQGAVDRATSALD
ncbi:hypothetical protein [Nodosilinea nodulosa]|uniref:hypothetical protein n=1 Tax=Nodosilinea nodulosa TaxID=416001 RepID=UPI0002FBDEEF|nr:hypothetical protein [Nodosilinea nodulosa]